MVYYGVSHWAPTSEIYHHGILGQKWGVRRYQNNDGSLTAAGRKRYGSDLDINDKSRKNIAKIRLGEARRRLDVAKSNNNTNTKRIAELNTRVKSAKKAVRDARAYDRGAKRVAKGETILGNKTKAFLVGSGAAFANNILQRYASKAASNAFNKNTGAYIAGRAAAASNLGKYGALALAAISTGYSIKKGIDNSNIRRYRSMEWSGHSSAKSIGSTEYRDVVDQKKKKTN